MQRLFTDSLGEMGIGDGDRILIAVSGGIDSVVLAHLFSGTQHESAIAHCNFQLRGEDSQADEVFVRDLALMLETPVYVKHFDVPAEMEVRGISLQMAARDLRYAWFEELAETLDYTWIATAHNLNDSVETFFLNLSRGTGIRGLTGIPRRSGRVIRPLHFASRADIQDYAESRNIDFREDRSNQETKYQRNKIRHDVIPHLQTLNPGFMETMHENMKRLRESRELLEKAVDEMRNAVFTAKANHLSVDIEALLKLQPGEIWMHELFAPYGFSKRQCTDILSVLGAPPGKRFNSPSHQLYKDRMQLILVKNPENEQQRFYLDSPERNSLLPFSLDVELIDREKLGPIPRASNVACLDAGLLDFPLTVRHWQPGDYFYPLGMDHMKKISDFFVDEKVPVPEKARIWILANGKQVVWVMGHRIDNRYRITGDTQKVLLLRLQPDV